MRALLLLFLMIIPIPKSEKRPLFSFGVIADVQYCDCDPAGTRYYRSSVAKLKEAVNDFRHDSVNFIVNLGDLIEKNIASYTPILDILKSSGLKVYHCLGNHDYSVEPGFKSKIPILQDHKNGYYSQTIDGFRLIFLNGNEISTYSDDNKEAVLRAVSYIQKLKADGEINAEAWNGGISKDQLQWLDNQLTESGTKKERVIIFCHFPIAPENMHNLLNYKEVFSVIEKHANIVAWINGHNHAGNYTFQNGIHFINMKGMVEKESVSSHATLKLFTDRMVIKGYGEEESRSLNFK